ncbi:MAG: thioesterase family protein [Pseudomonadota bacterium]
MTASETPPAAARPSPRPSPDRRDAYAAFLTFTTRWRDNDAYGHMNNVVYYEYFDTAVNQWLIEQGLLVIETSPMIGLVVETQCAYFAPLSFPERVTAGLRTARIGGSSVTYEIGLFRGEDATACAQGRFTHVYVERESRRPTALSPAFRDALAGLNIGA